MSTKQEKKGKLDMYLQGFPLVRVCGWSDYEGQGRVMKGEHRFSFIKAEVCKISSGSLVHFFHLGFGDGMGKMISNFLILWLCFSYAYDDYERVSVVKSLQLE